MKKLIILILAVAGLQAETLLNTGTGNLMTAATWLLAEAGAGSSQLTLTSGTNTTTSYVASAAFTCTSGKIINKILLHGKQTTVTGTVTMGLSDDGGTTYKWETVVNATDLPTAYSWIAFSFGASPPTCDGGVDYKVAIKASSAANATFYRGTTGGDWTRILFTSDPSAGVDAGDILYITGDWAPTGGSTYTVTIDDTASTDFGMITVGDRGILASGVTAATAYTLKVSGDLTVWANGQFNVPSDMPVDSSLTVTMDCSSNVLYGIIFKDGSASTIHGRPLTYDRAWLSADIIVNATALTTDVSTGWVSGDVIAVASTTRTFSESEQGDLNGDAVGTALTVHGFGGAGGGVAYAHSGTAPTRAEIINLSRNVRIRGASAALQTYVLVNTTAAVSWDAVELSWMGSNTGSKRGVDVLTTTGSFSLTNSAVHHFVVANSNGIRITGAASDNYTISNNVFYATSTNLFVSVATTGTNWAVSGNIFMLTDANATAVYVGDVGGIFTNNTIISAGWEGLIIEEGANLPIGTFSGNTIHSAGRYGLWLNLTTSTTHVSGMISNTTIWRCNNLGALINGIQDIIFDGITAFGNVTANWQFNASTYNVTVNNATLNGDTTFSTVSGILFNNNAVDVRITNSSLGVAGGIKTAHITGDITLSNGVLVQVSGDKVTFGSGTPISNLGAITPHTAWIGINHYGGAANDHRRFTPIGSTTVDTTIFKATPAERLNPETTGLLKYQGSPKYMALDDGDTVTISVWVYGSVVGDGEAYGGAHPRLMMEANPGLGYNSDVVLDTRTVANGTWELLTNTVTATGDNGVVKVYVDCDGTTGFVTVDSWSASGEKDPSGQKYWLYGLPSPGVTPSGTGFGGGTVSWGVAR
jgi:hypothetical protein